MVHHTVLLDDCIESMKQVEEATIGKVVVKIAWDDFVLRRKLSGLHVHTETSFHSFPEEFFLIFGKSQWHFKNVWQNLSEELDKDSYICIQRSICCNAGKYGNKQETKTNFLTKLLKQIWLD